MNTTPKKEYGWVIIDTPEKKAQFGPRKAGDQYYGGIGNCLHWEEAVWSSDSSKTSVGCAGSPFSESDIYRRRIDPGKGYEIVPGETFETADMEFTRDGVAWRSNAQAATYAMRCADYPDRTDIIAFRRKKKPRWNMWRDSKPEVGHALWIYRNEVGQWILNYWPNGARDADIPSFDMQNITHWRYADASELPTPPTPETDAECAFRKWHEKHNGAPLRMGWMAGVKWQKERIQ